MLLADQLFGLYTAEVYPILAQNDPEYQRVLLQAGLGWHGANSGLSNHRNSFEQVMKMQATLGATRIQDARSLDPSTMRAKIISGPTTLYRVGERGSAARPSIWWFTEKVAQRCREEAGPDPAKRLDWLRNVLAVCFNWSSFNQIQRIALRSDEKLPAILGRGLAMPHYKLGVDRRTNQVSLPVDYWQKKGQTLLGGELQIVLPWVPERRVFPSDSL